MKKYALCVAVCLMAPGLFSQEKKDKSAIAPAAAKAAFKKAYPAATKVKWGKEDGDYEVNFATGSKEMSAVYDASGTMKESEEDIKISELPAAVTTYVRQHYKGAAIKEAARITSANGGVTYEAEVNKMDIIFDKDGKFIKEVKD